MTIPRKPFYFMRHGETDWNQRQILMGSKDIPLNQKGIEQAEMAAQWLMEEPIDHIITSPLLRSLKTAEIISSKLQKPVTIVDDLKERGWGPQEGKFADWTVLGNWINDSEQEGVESNSIFEERVMRGFTRALELPGTPFIIAHGGVYLGLSKRLGFPSVDLRNCAPLYHRPEDEMAQLWFVWGVGDGGNDYL